MPCGLDRYGLRDNPFRLRLEPLVQSLHEDMVVPVDGFRKLSAIDEYLRQTANQEKPLFFLVTGRNGTGRTCVADYILARYRHYRQIPAERFIVPHREVDDDYVFQAFQSWLIFLYNGLSDLRPVVKLLDVNLLSKVQAASETTMEAIYQGLMTSLHKVVANQNVGFGCCLEDVPNYGYISAAFKIFQKTQTVCVFTAKDYEEGRTKIIEPFKQKAMGQVIELSPLVGQHVKTLVEQRWRQTTQSPSPFDPEGLANAFDIKTWTIARALWLASKILEFKVPLHIDGGQWPQDETLRVSPNELEHYIRTLDED